MPATRIHYVSTEPQRKKKKIVFRRITTKVQNPENRKFAVNGIIKTREKRAELLDCKCNAVSKRSWNS